MTRPSAFLLTALFLFGTPSLAAAADTSGCPADSPPQVIKTTPSPIPDAYQKLGRSNDEVILDVKLDQNSRILNIAVEGTTEPLLNAAAIDEARASIFRTAVANCKPIAATYRFVFAYSSP